MSTLTERLSVLSESADDPLPQNEVTVHGRPSSSVHHLPMDDGNDADAGIGLEDVELAERGDEGFRWAIPVDDGWLRFSLPEGLTPSDIGVDAIRADETD